MGVSGGIFGKISKEISRSFWNISEKKPDGISEGNSGAILEENIGGISTEVLAGICEANYEEFNKLFERIVNE